MWRAHMPRWSHEDLSAAHPAAVKVLFSGHRGSGKSTELMRLAEDLQNEFFVVPFSARSLNLADLSYVDIMLACAAALFREATDRARGGHHSCCRVEAGARLAHQRNHCRDHGECAQDGEL
jgi:hypothetical protein